jgi:hypothetical protein
LFEYERTLRDPFVVSRKRRAFYKKLSIEERRLRDRIIPRAALQLPEDSAFQKLFNSKNDQALITFTGLDHSTFSWLLEKFQPLLDKYSPFISETGGLI